MRDVIFDELRPGRLFERELEFGFRLRIAGGEQRRVVAGLEETVREESDHPFDTAVSLGRHREPWRSDLRDAHGSG